MSLKPNRVFPVSTAARSSHGFTLIELLVAVTLLALVTMLTFGGFRFGTRAWERAAAHLDHAAEIQIVQAFLRRRLSEAAPVLKPGDNPDGEIFFEGDRTSLRFVTVMPIHLQTGGYSVLDLTLERGSLASGLMLRWSPFQFGTELPETADPDERVLLKRINRFNIAYFGLRSDDDEVPSWSDEWRGNKRLPLLVRFRIEFSDEGLRDWPELVVAPVVAGRPRRRG